MTRSFAAPMITDKKPVRDFFQLAIQHGLRDIVLSPGSRNAPFSASLPSISALNTHVVVDERSAGFIALGMAQQTQRPIILLCTSGTAPLNYAPAIAEAYYQRVPMLIVTADRPHEWIDQGEGQSIRQTDVYRNFVKGSFEVRGEDQAGDGAWYNARLIDEAMRLCTDRVPGPVHLNFPLQEPLYRAGSDTLDSVKSMERIAVHSALSPQTQRSLQHEIDLHEKVMVLAGQLPHEESLQRSLALFSERSNVLVLTEAHSHLTDVRYITTIDRFLAAVDESEHEALRPNLLITIGHNIISRKIKQLLRSGAYTHWHIDITGEGLDTLKHLNRIIPQSPAEFFQSMGAGDSGGSNYQSFWLERHAKSRERAADFLGRAGWSDLLAFESIHAQIPSGTLVQLGNSSAIRYVLLNDSRADLKYFGNRGVAGIDGCSSTTVGAAQKHGGETLLLSGDLGFFYDINAWWNDLPKNRIKVVIINNGGGGIFRIIDGPLTSGEAFEPHFEASHDRTAESAASMFAIPYKQADDLASLNVGLNWLFAQSSCAWLEVLTPRTQNDLELKGYFSYIRQAFLKHG